MKLKEKMTEEYLDDLLVRIAHHSTAIEGNTISLNGAIVINKEKENYVSIKYIRNISRNNSNIYIDSEIK